MDYEKAYKAVLETATQWIKDGCTDKERICLESVFPELRGNGDERIRKEIIEYLKLHDKGENDYAHAMFSEWFAWLEKQKEPHYTKRNALFDKCVENCDPKTVEEVNKRVDDIMSMPELSAFEQALTNFIGDWQDDEERWPSKFVKKHGKHILDMAREELQKEQKPLITGNDFGWIDELKHDLKHPEELDQKVDDVLKQRKGIRTLEWSEEDEKMLNLTKTQLRILQSHLSHTHSERMSDMEYSSRLLQIEKCVSWLDIRFKSLRPQPSWKPSEEQMEALRKVAYNLVGTGTETDIHLVKLYEQLKKLGVKEEPEYYQHFDPDC